MRIGSGHLSYLQSRTDRQLGSKLGYWILLVGCNEAYPVDQSFSTWVPSLSSIHGKTAVVIHLGRTALLSSWLVTFPSASCVILVKMPYMP